MLFNALENVLGCFGLWGMFWAGINGRNVLGMFWAYAAL
jgi:hypothetical protein